MGRDTASDFARRTMEKYSYILLASVVVRVVTQDCIYLCNCLFWTLWRENINEEPLALIAVARFRSYEESCGNGASL